MKVRYSIPDSEIEILKKFLDLPKEKKKIFIDKLETITPDDPKTTIDEIEKETHIQSNEILDFIHFFDGLCTNFIVYDKPIDKYFEDVIFKSIEKSKIEIDIDENLKLLLKSVFSFDKGIGVFSKISYLLSENPNIIFNAKIFTDLRPIFHRDPKKKLKYAIIKNTLRLTFLRNRKMEEIHYTLDLEDLKQLQNTITRAINKIITLKQFSERGEMKIIDEEIDI